MDAQYVRLGTESTEPLMALERFIVENDDLEWDEDEKPEPEVIREAVKKTLNELYPKLEKTASVLKPLCNLPTVPKIKG